MKWDDICPVCGEGPCEREAEIQEFIGCDDDDCPVRPFVDEAARARPCAAFFNFQGFPYRGIRKPAVRPS